MLRKQRGDGVVLMIRVDMHAPSACQSFCTRGLVAFGCIVVAPSPKKMINFGSVEVQVGYNAKCNAESRSGRKRPGDKSRGLARVLQRGACCRASKVFSERLNFFPQPDQAPTSTPIRSRSSISVKMFKRYAIWSLGHFGHVPQPIEAD